MLLQSAKAFRRFVPTILLAAGLAPGSTAFAAESYVFDKNHTEIRFSWTHMGINRMSACCSTLMAR